MLVALKMFLALGVPWLAGITMISALWSKASVGRVAAVLGYGYFLGIVLAVLLLLALDHLLGGWHYLLVQCLLASIALGAGIRFRHWLPLPPSPEQLLSATGRIWAQSSIPVRVIAGGVIVLVVGRFAVYLLQVLWMPVFAWDAWATWSHIAKTLFEADGLSFVTSDERFLTSSLIPLAQVWQALALGRWDESLVNLPWWVAGLALPLALYGQLRGAGVDRLPSLIFVYVLVALPMYGVHVMLGGYFELWLSAFIALAVMAGYHIAAGLNRRQWLLFLICVAIIPFLDRHTIIHAAILLGAFMTGAISGRWLAALAAGGAILLLAWIYTLGIDLPLPKEGRIIVNSETFYFSRVGSFSQAPAWGALWQRLMADGTWLLLWFIAPWVIILGVLRFPEPGHRLVGISVITILALVLAVNLFTKEQINLVNGTGINRHLLAIVPALLFWVALVLGLRATGATCPDDGQTRGLSWPRVSRSIKWRAGKSE
ncbi:hypothetical protein F2Q65_02430 [Thiohalocapsa marina]|uniref:Glycosyltransferase RgtA/B/C/D-like domain-containing protein n=1 Tax=Thiohalocapsa marina TaxID=424902 RepID=A0A5M8FU99_9GAMM|nr:hypothetical protein [Thiohalocapsa marina]KAA6187398.1 hypothetical protein F2Q65_02430 [Thiohalocapsa marina]